MSTLGGADIYIIMYTVYKIPIILIIYILYMGKHNKHIPSAIHILYAYTCTASKSAGKVNVIMKFHTIIF